MPARRALRTLTLGFELAVFLWRRYSSLSQRSAPDTDAPPVEPPDHQRVVSVAEDNDADDSEAEDDDTQDLSPEHTQTINFGLDGQNYAIDLTDQSAAELRETLDRYIAAGRVVGRRTRTLNIATARPRAGQSARADRQDAAAIRQWARAHGHRISDRGPIPATVRQAYAARRRGRAG
jgi:nucleoid-associated protein Lsr2